MLGRFFIYLKDWWVFRKIPQKTKWCYLTHPITVPGQTIREANSLERKLIKRSIFPFPREVTHIHFGPFEKTLISRFPSRGASISAILATIQQFQRSLTISYPVVITHTHPSYEYISPKGISHHPLSGSDLYLASLLADHLKLPVILRATTASFHTYEVIK